MVIIRFRGVRGDLLGGNNKQPCLLTCTVLLNCKTRGTEGLHCCKIVRTERLIHQWIRDRLLAAWWPRRGWRIRDLLLEFLFLPRRKGIPNGRTGRYSFGFYNGSHRALLAPQQAQARAAHLGYANDIHQVIQHNYIQRIEARHASEKRLWHDLRFLTEVQSLQASREGRPQKKFHQAM